MPRLFRIKSFASQISTHSTISFSIWLYISIFKSPQMSFLARRTIMFSSFIFRRSHNFKMFRIYTNSIFTQMINMKTFRNNLILKMQNRPMCRSITNFFISNPVSIPVMRFASKPNPTTIFKFFNLHQKSFFSVQMNVNAHSWHTTIGGHFA